MTIALARRYRPKRFEDLLVQDHVAAALRGAVARNRVGHGYLLTGPRGVGKTTAARILAMALNCERRDPEAPTGEPCGECQSCGRIWSGSANLDVVEIDAASNRGVDDARELRERAMYAASQAGHHKVYIIDEAHMLTREAWNALLKILEEPPPGVVFVFATTEPQKIANTAAPVMSRLQRFDFRRIGPTAIRDRLREVLAAEGLEAEEDALLLIARHADGGMRDALSVLDQCLSFSEGSITETRVRETLGVVGDDVYAEVLRFVVARDPAPVFPLVDRLMDAGADLADFMGGLADALRALLMAQVGTEPEGLTETMRQTIADVRSALPAEDVLRMLRLLADAEAAIRRSANPRLTVETLMLRWALMDRIVDLEQVLAGAPAAAPAPATPRGAGTPPRQAPAPSQRPGPRAAAPRAADPSPPPAEEPPPARQAAAPSGARVAFTPEALQAVWRDIASDARARSMFLGQALSAGRPVAVNPPELTVQFDAHDAVLVEALERQRAVAEEILSSRVGEPVRLAITLGDTGGKAGGGGGGPAPGGDPGPGGNEPACSAEPPRPRRITEAGIRAERLKELRGADPALDMAVDELDLEIVDEA